MNKDELVMELSFEPKTFKDWSSRERIKMRET